MKSKFCIKLILVLAVFVSVKCVRAGGYVAAWGDNTYGQTTLPPGVGIVKAVSAGFGHVLALKTDGTVIAWGNNSYGQTNVPAGLSKVVAIAAGGFHNLALKADGTVVAWGENNFSQVNVPRGLSNVVGIAAGEYHSLALKANGTVVAWGCNTSGQTDVPPSLSNVITIAAGEDHSLALKADGTVVAWGENSVFEPVLVPAGLSNVVAIAAGGDQDMVLKADGSVVQWGFYDGIWYQSDPLYNMSPPSSHVTNVIGIAAGFAHELALNADGTVVSWNINPTPFGFVRIVLTNVPMQLSNATAIAAGRGTSFALVFDGPVQITENPQSQSINYASNVTFSVVASGAPPLYYQWLLNGRMLVDNARVSGATSGNLTITDAQFSDAGIYTVVVSNALGSVQVAGAMLSIIGPPIVTGPSGTNLVVRAGANVILTVPVEGTPLLSYQWLFNGTNFPGTAGTVLSLTNVQPETSGVYSLLVTNAYGSTQVDLTLTVTDSAPYIVSQPRGSAVRVGTDFTFAVVAAGSQPLSYQWQFNGAEIPGATNATLILSNLDYSQTGYYYVSVRNPFGAAFSAKVLLGVGQTAVQVWSPYSKSNDPTNVPPDLTNAVAIAAGEYHVLVLKRDGTVATWSSSSLGSSEVTDIPASVNHVVAIAVGSVGINSSMALKSDGTVAIWGDSYLLLERFFGLANVPMAATNVVAIADGGDHCLAVRPDDSVVGWGNNDYGQATPPPGLSNVVSVAAGNRLSVALKNDGTVAAWGDDFFGQTNVPAGLTNVIAISANTAGNVVVALMADGTVTNWGSQVAGMPQNVTNIVAISTVSNSVAALKSAGTVVSWGLSMTNFPSSISNVIAIASGGIQPPFLAAIVGDGSPFITIQPLSRTTTTGTTIRFHARAVGRQPLSYQWQFNGTNLLGATNGDLILPSVQVSDLGNYQVVVANALGAVTSRVAQLTIPYTGTLAMALNATNLYWFNTFTNIPWSPEISVTHDGVAATQSGPITDNQQSVLQTTVVGPGTLTFWWKVSSEEGFDFLNFYLDNTNLARVSGDMDWQELSFHIPPGSHSLRWIYAKDESVSMGQDAGWLDQVTFTPVTLRLSAPRLLLNGNIAFTAAAADGEPLANDDLYGSQVEASTNLVDWTTISGGPTLTNGMLLFEDSTATNAPIRLYRIIENQ